MSSGSVETLKSSCSEVCEGDSCSIQKGFCFANTILKRLRTRKEGNNISAPQRLSKLLSVGTAFGRLFKEEGISETIAANFLVAISSGFNGSRAPGELESSKPGKSPS